MENKENFFTRFINFIKKIFGNDAPKQITEKSQVIEEPVSKTNFFDKIKVVPDENTLNSKSMKLQKHFENDELDLCVMSDEEIHELNSLYKEQVSDLKTKLKAKKEQLKSLQSKVSLT